MEITSMETPLMEPREDRGDLKEFEDLKKTLVNLCNRV